MLIFPYHTECISVDEQLRLNFPCFWCTFSLFLKKNSDWVILFSSGDHILTNSPCNFCDPGQSTGSRNLSIKPRSQMSKTSISRLQQNNLNQQPIPNHASVLKHQDPGWTLSVLSINASLLYSPIDQSYPDRGCSRRRGQRWQLRYVRCVISANFSDFPPPVGILVGRSQDHMLPIYPLSCTQP